MIYLIFLVYPFCIFESNLIKMQTNLNKNTIDLGVYLGALLFVITAAIYMYDVKLFTDFTLIMPAFMIPALGFSIYSVVNAKKLQNNLITFKDAFIAYFLCIAIGYLIVTIANIVIFKFIDPAAADIIHQEIMISTKEMLANFGTPNEAIQMTMQEMQNNHSFSFENIFLTYANTLLRNAIFGCLVALIFKNS